jgi:carbon storage regulator
VKGSYPLFKEEMNMLVLSRKIGEQIVINHNIRVTVVEIQGNKIRLGIDAPHDVRVDRAEVHQRRQDFFEVDASHSAVAQAT